MKFVVDNSDEFVEEADDDGKNVEVMSIKFEAMVVSGVSDMILALLEDSVLKFVEDNSDET